jgi:diaminopimelate epimerase
MKIPFIKAHGALNDFLLTRAEEAPAKDRAEFARALCDRHAGVGADGWLLVGSPETPGCHARIELYNSDGSVAEISGNGTRCAAAHLLYRGLEAETIRISTGAGVKSLRLVERSGHSFVFEMNMGRAEIRDLHASLPLAGGPRDAVILWVGNPQCAVPVEHFDFDWRAVGAEIERHPMFPDRTNVSFLRAVDEHTLEVRFFERGAGETMSSGTGSTGAVAAAVARGMARSSVRVLTPAGPLDIRWDDEIFLTGPAVITAEGVYLV